MSNHIITLDTPLGANHVLNLIGGGDNKDGMLSRLADVLHAVDAGAYAGKLRVKVGATSAVGTITFASFADADTITVNGTVLTGKTSPVGTAQFAVGASNEACSNNAVAKINASALAKIGGTVGASRRGTVLLNGFVDGDTVTVQGYVFTGKNTPTDGNQQQFMIGGSDSLTAENLKNALATFQPTKTLTVTRSAATLTVNFYGSLTLAASAHATVSSDIVVITAIVPGQIGNLCTLAISAHGSVVAPTGGAEGTMYTESKNYNLVV